MLVVTIDAKQSLRLETPSGEVIGRLHLAMTPSGRIRCAIDLPQDIRVLREKEEADAKP